MSDGLALDLIVEDQAQELFIGAMVRRLAVDCGRAVALRTLSARGGRPQVFRILTNYEAITMGSHLAVADSVVVAVDGNGDSFAATRAKVLEQAPAALASRIVVACPVPYVERWFLADPESLRTALGVAPTPRSGGRQKEDYKALLLRTVRGAGHIPVLGGAEFAPTIVEAMNLYRAGKNHSSLKAFLDDVRSLLLRTSPD